MQISYCIIEIKIKLHNKQDGGGDLHNENTMWK